MTIGGLKKLFSTTSLTHCLGLSGTFSKETVAYITPFIEQVESKLNSIKDETDQYISEQISVLNAKIKQQSNQLCKKRPRLSSELIEDEEFELELNRQRLEKIESDPLTTEGQIVRNKFKEWKNKINKTKSQKGKKAGKYLIDRRAETSIYERLTEVAKARRRKHGEEGTSYIDEAFHRIQSREMRAIANIGLKQLNARLIKSKKTNKQ